MKRFGFHTDQLYYNLRNPQKVKYIFTKEHGAFEMPKHKKSTNVNEIYKNYEKRLDFEKYMNPFGIKQTISSSFQKPQEEHDFVNHDMMLMLSQKPYKKNIVSFRCSPYLSKPEIK